MAGGGSPDTTSTEGSNSPSSASTNPKGYLAPVTKKKRVRRQQVELKYLRELVEKLEHRLGQLKKRRPNGQSNGNDSSGVQHNIRFGPSPVWESIADRQFKERSRIEKQNKNLKLMLRAQTSTAQSLQAKAQRALGDKELIGLTMMQLHKEGPRYWDLGSGDEEGIFADLLTLVARTHLQLKQLQVEDPRTVLSFASWGISVGEPRLRTDSEVGLVLETHGSSLLPFDVKTTATAFWKMFSLSPANHKLTFHDQKSAVHDDMVARSFTCSSTHFGSQINVSGKHTCRKYVDDDGCTTIVFAGRTGPTKASAPCQEVQLQKTGWVKVRRYRSDYSDQQLSTVVEMHTETLPRFRHGNTGQEQRAREVIDYAMKSHHLVNDWCRQKLSEILVEEDWKAFRGSDDIYIFCFLVPNLRVNGAVEAVQSVNGRFRARQDAEVSDTFDRLLDDTTPTLLYFLGSLDKDAGLALEAVALPVRRPKIANTAEDKPQAKKKKTNTWRQRQRLEVLRLRDEVKKLDKELKKMKLATGVRSTLPLMEGGSSFATDQLKRPAPRKLLGESWQDAASRESLSRHMSSIENERLHKALHMQVKHARKLHRMIQQQMTTTIVSQALGYRPALTDDEGRPPTDNSTVFQKLLADLDGHRGNIRHIFVVNQMAGEQEGCVSINPARGLQVRIVKSYTFPFSANDTKQAVWNVLTEKEGIDRTSKVAYNERFEVDNNTSLQSVRTFVVAGPYELCFLVRKGCRRYVKDDLTHFVVHETSIVSSSYGVGVSYDEVVWRIVKQGQERLGGPTAIVETHVLATFPSYKALSCLPTDGLKGFHDAYMRFNHKVEDVLVSHSTASQPQ